MRIIAILASYNEELYVRACFDNFIRQGVEIYLIDNESTDSTVEIARSYLGRGLIGVETFPRRGVYQWEPILRRKEEISVELCADWYVHADMDEIRLPPRSGTTLSSALREADEAGFNAVNFRNFLFLPTAESPDHEHLNFPETMLWYRYMEPSYPNQIKAWKKQPAVNLAQSGGHMVEFEGRKLYPIDFIMKHYQVLSLRHAIQKYAVKIYAPEELRRGWHGWKATVKADELRLPFEREMRRFTSDDDLDTSDPIKRTPIFAASQSDAVSDLTKQKVFL